MSEVQYGCEVHLSEEGGQAHFKMRAWSLDCGPINNFFLLLLFVSFTHWCEKMIRTHTFRLEDVNLVSTADFSRVGLDGEGLFPSADLLLASILLFTKREVDFLGFRSASLE